MVTHFPEIENKWFFYHFGVGTGACCLPDGARCLGQNRQTGNWPLETLER